MPGGLHASSSAPSKLLELGVLWAWNLPKISYLDLLIIFRFLRRLKGLWHTGLKCNVSGNRACKGESEQFNLLNDRASRAAGTFPIILQFIVTQMTNGQHLRLKKESAASTN